MVESSLKEVDAGVIEAARSMGASNFTIITKVMLVEARTSLLVGATITLGTILGYSAMSGAVGGGGLGAIAIRYGYTRWQTDIMIVTVILLIILFQIFQTVGMKLADKFDHRKYSNKELNPLLTHWSSDFCFAKTRRIIMKKRVLSSILAGVLAVSVFAGCGSKTEDNSQAADNSTTPATEAAAEESTEAAGGTVESKGTITVAASATPHAEILAAAKPILAEQGWDLEVTEFDDYVLPNEVVESGEMDANYFQHVPYLDSFNEEKGTHLVEVGKIHYEPFGIYPGTKSSLDDIADGDVIAVPNDTTNEARALLLLQDNGIITLKDGAGLEATVNDIAENPYNVEIQELAAESVARVADEVAYVVLNGNYALQAGFSVAKDALAYEKSDSEAAKTYVNVIVVKEGNEDNEGVKALVDVLKSDEIKDFINNTYDGAVIPFEE